MVNKTLDEQLEDLYTKGFDRYKVERFVENAAMKASPIFQAFGIEYGDRVPGMYKLAEDIEELLLNVIDKREDYWVESGQFHVGLRVYEDEQDELTIHFVLDTSKLEDLKEKR